MSADAPVRALFKGWRQPTTSLLIRAIRTNGSPPFEGGLQGVGIIGEEVRQFRCQPLRELDPLDQKCFSPITLWSDVY
jgi:hypothetical protein